MLSFSVVIVRWNGHGTEAFLRHSSLWGVFGIERRMKNNWWLNIAPILFSSTIQEQTKKKSKIACKQHAKHYTEKRFECRRLISYIVLHIEFSHPQIKPNPSRAAPHWQGGPSLQYSSSLDKLLSNLMVNQLSGRCGNRHFLVPVVGAPFWSDGKSTIVDADPPVMSSTTPAIHQLTFFPTKPIVVQSDRHPTASRNSSSKENPT